MVYSVNVSLYKGAGHALRWSWSHGSWYNPLAVFLFSGSHCSIFCMNSRNNRFSSPSSFISFISRDPSALQSMPPSHFPEKGDLSDEFAIYALDKTNCPLAFFVYESVDQLAARM